MVGKCANPECAAKFRYLHQGRLFQVDMRRLSGGREGRMCEFCGHPHHVRHFWLCDACARTMTLTCTTEGCVELVRRSIPGTFAVPLACPPESADKALESEVERERRPVTSGPCSRNIRDSAIKNE